MWCFLATGAYEYIDKHKKKLSYINACLLASVPWVQVGQGHGTTQSRLKVAAKALQMAKSHQQRDRYLCINEDGCFISEAITVQALLEVVDTYNLILTLLSTSRRLCRI